MGVELDDRGLPLPRYFGAVTWTYAVVMAGFFVAVPPYPSSGRGWTLRVAMALVIGLGAGLTEVWVARRDERRARAGRGRRRSGRSALPKQRA